LAGLGIVWESEEKEGKSFGEEGSKGDKLLFNIHRRVCVCFFFLNGEIEIL